MTRWIIALCMVAALSVPAAADDVVLSDITGLQAAIDGAPPEGRTIEISAGTYDLATEILVNKPDITIQGQGALATVIRITGTGYRFSISAPRCAIQNLDISSIDTADQQNIIWLNASDIAVRNNRIHGLFVVGNSQVSRAMVVSGGHSGLQISDNEIYGLRQPAYVTGTTTGTVSNNHVYRTKGWVLDGGNLTLTGNTWGSGPDANAYDIAILASVPSIYYTDILALAAANNSAVIEDQRVSPPVLSVVHVDASAAPPGEGSPLAPYPNIGLALTRVVAGGRIEVADGTYVQSATLHATRSLSLIGPSEAGVIIDCSGFGGYGIHADGDLTTAFRNFTLIGPSAPAYGYGLHVTGDGSYTTVENLTVLHSGRSGISLHGVDGASVVNLTATGNGGVGLGLTDARNVTLSGLTTSGNAWAGVGIYTSGAYYTGGTDNVVLSGTNSFGEPVGLYTEEEGGYGITNVTIPASDFPWLVGNILVAGTKAYVTTGPVGLAVATGGPDPAHSYVLNRVTGQLLVAPPMSIQVAINVAAPGAEVVAGPGTYSGGIVADKPIVLNGEVGAVIAGAGGSGSGAGIEVRSGDVTIQGFEIHHFQNGISTWMPTKPEFQNLKILNNVLHDLTGPSHGFALYIGWESERWDPCQGIYDPTLTDWLDYTGLEIRGNTIYGTANAAICLQMLQSTGSPLLIQDNEIYDASASAIWVDGAQDPLIASNDLHDCQNGIFFSSYADMECWTQWGQANDVWSPRDETVTGNRIHGNANGVVLWHGWPALMDFGGNSIWDNTTRGVANNLSTNPPLDADFTGCWWGAPSGPYHPTANPAGEGNQVSDHVLFQPFLAGNIVIVPDPQEITTVDTAGEDWVTLRYLGGLSGPLYGFSLQLSLPAELDILSVERPLSGPFATAQPFQPVDQGSIWMVDAAIGGAHPGTEGPCDLARVRVKGLSCAATGATLDLEIARLRDSFNHTLTGGVSDDGLVFVDLGDPEITAASLVRTNLPDNGFVKNGDTMRLAATLTDPCGDLAGLTVTADLSELLGVGHEAEAPTGYDPDTGEAYWDFVVAGDPDGIKTVAITAVDALGNDAALDPAGSVELDNTAPAVFVTGLSAAPGHNKIDLSWTNPVGGDPDREAFGIMIRRVGWGDYPEYATAAPVYPDAATGTKVLEAGGLPDSYLDTTFPGPWSGRDIYYYQAFVFDKAYNYGPGDAGACDRATSYWLGDVDPKQDYDPGPPEVPSTIGDGFVVFSYDVTSLSGSYYAAEGPAPWNAHCDVGPTDDYSRLGIPQPDNHVDFEDLMIFAMNYGVVTPLQGAVPGVFASAVPPALQWRVTPGTGELVGRLVLANNRGMVKGAHALVRYDASQLELLGVEKGVLAQPEGVFFASVRQEGAVVLDAAQLGEDLAFAGSGELAVVRFRARGNARPVLAESAVRTVLNHAPGWQPGTAESALADGRTGAKSPEAPPEVAAPALPATIAFHGAAPNPFTGSTELSFALPRESHVSLQVYDVSGRLARTIADRVLPAGEHSLSWNGAADDGRRLGAGVYFVAFQCEQARSLHRIAIVR